VLTELEMEVVEEETVFIEDPEAEIEETWAAEQASWGVPSEPRPEPVETARSNGSGEAHEGAPKTLEDSVKDMLRPMLRQWLDENMSRVVTAVLKDEIENDPARYQRD
jgi:cell pole-organizing protein PopZ